MEENTSLLEAIDKKLPALIQENDRRPSFSRSEWIGGQEGKVYIRAGRRLLDPGSGQLMEVIDIATVELFEEYQGTRG